MRNRIDAFQRLLGKLDIFLLRFRFDFGDVAEKLDDGHRLFVKAVLDSALEAAAGGVEPGAGERNVVEPDEGHAQLLHGRQIVLHERRGQAVAELRAGLVDNVVGQMVRLLVPAVGIQSVDVVVDMAHSLPHSSLGDFLRVPWGSAS